MDAVQCACRLVHPRALHPFPNLPGGRCAKRVDWGTGQCAGVRSSACAMLGVEQPPGDAGTAEPKMPHPSARVCTHSCAPLSRVERVASALAAGGGGGRRARTTTSGLRPRNGVEAKLPSKLRASFYSPRAFDWCVNRLLTPTGRQFGRLLKAHMSPQDHRRKIAISRRHLHGFRSKFDV